MMHFIIFARLQDSQAPPDFGNPEISLRIAAKFAKVAASQTFPVQFFGRKMASVDEVKISEGQVHFWVPISGFIS